MKQIKQLLNVETMGLDSFLKLETNEYLLSPQLKQPTENLSEKKSEILKIEDNNNYSMPLVFLPKTSDNRNWNEIAYNILRSVNSEQSFAGHGSLGSLKRKNKQEINKNNYKIDKFLNFNEQDNISNMYNFSSNIPQRKFYLSKSPIILKYKNNNQNNKFINKSWEKIHDIMDFNWIEENDDSNSELDFLTIRRNSCYCENCGRKSKFSEKVDRYINKFITRNANEKSKVQKSLSFKLKDDKQKSISANLSSKVRIKPKIKENTTLIILKNQNKPIKNLINSSINMKNSLRKSCIIPDAKSNNIKKEKETPKMITDINFFDINLNTSINNYDIKENAEEMEWSKMKNNENNIKIKNEPIKITEYSPQRRSTCDVPRSRKESEFSKKASPLLKKSKTFKEKEKEKIIEVDQLEKNIQLIYNQFSPSKSNSFLNSPKNSRPNSLKKNDKNHSHFQNYNNQYNKEEVEKIISINSRKFGINNNKPKDKFIGATNRFINTYHSNKLIQLITKEKSTLKENKKLNFVIRKITVKPDSQKEFEKKYHKKNKTNLNF